MKLAAIKCIFANLCAVRSVIVRSVPFWAVRRRGEVAVALDYDMREERSKSG